MNFWKQLLLSVYGLIALCGCAPVDILNATIPRGGYTLYHGITYDEATHQKLDIYAPAHPAPGHPVIVFFHGGSWQTGNKNQYLFVGQAFASKGFTTVIADYRLYPKVYFPTFLEDSAKAVVWTYEHIGNYGGNAQNLFLSGHSSGAYLAVMLTVDDQYLKNAGGKEEWIKGTIGIAGPYDFLPFTDPAIKALFSTAPDSDTQPINYVRPGLPPMLLLYGDADTQVYPRNSIHLAGTLRASGDSVTEKMYPGIGHIGIILSVARGFRYKAPALEDVASFVERYSKE